MKQSPDDSDREHHDDDDREDGDGRYAVRVDVPDRERAQGRVEQQGDREDEQPQAINTRGCS